MTHTRNPGASPSERLAREEPNPQGELFPEAVSGCAVLAVPPRHWGCDAAWIIGPLSRDANGALVYGALLASFDEETLRLAEVRPVDVGTCLHRSKGKAATIHQWVEAFMRTAAFDRHYGVAGNDAEAMAASHAAAVQRFRQDLQTSQEHWVRLLAPWPRLATRAQRLWELVAWSGRCLVVMASSLVWQDAGVGIFEVPPQPDGKRVGDRALELSRLPLVAALACHGRTPIAVALRRYAAGDCSAGELAATGKRWLGTANMAALMGGWTPGPWGLSVRAVERILHLAPPMTLPSSRASWSRHFVSHALGVASCLELPPRLAVQLCLWVTGAEDFEIMADATNRVSELAAEIDRVWPERQRIDELRAWRALASRRLAALERRMRQLPGPQARWVLAADLNGITPDELASNLLQLLPELSADLDGGESQLVLARSMDELEQVGDALHNCLANPERVVDYVALGRVVASVRHQDRVVAAFTIDIRLPAWQGLERNWIGEPLGVANQPAPARIKSLVVNSENRLRAWLDHPAIGSYRQRWRAILRQGAAAAGQDPRRLFDAVGGAAAIRLRHRAP